MKGYYSGDTWKFNKHWQSGEGGQGKPFGLYGIWRGNELVVAPPAYKFHINFMDYENISFTGRSIETAGFPLWRYGIGKKTEHRFVGRKYSNIELRPVIPRRYDGGRVVDGIYGGLADKSKMPYTGAWTRHNQFGDSRFLQPVEFDAISTIALETMAVDVRFLTATVDIIGLTGTDAPIASMAFTPYIEKMDDNAKATTDGDGQFDFRMKTRDYGQVVGNVALGAIDEWRNLSQVLNGVSTPSQIISGKMYNTTESQILTIDTYMVLPNVGTEMFLSTFEKMDATGDGIVGGMNFTTYDYLRGYIWTKATANDLFTATEYYGSRIWSFSAAVAGEYMHAYMKIKSIRSDEYFRISDIVRDI